MVGAIRSTEATHGCDGGAAAGIGPAGRSRDTSGSRDKGPPPRRRRMTPQKNILAPPLNKVLSRGHPHNSHSAHHTGQADTRHREENMDFLDSSVKPLFFKVADSSTLGLFPPEERHGDSLRSWVRWLPKTNIQKEALVASSRTGAVWHLASDEGPYL